MRRDAIMMSPRHDVSTVDCSVFTAVYTGTKIIKVAFKNATARVENKVAHFSGSPCRYSVVA